MRILIVVFLLGAMLGCQPFGAEEAPARPGKADPANLPEGYLVEDIPGSDAQRVVKRDKEGNIVEEGMLYDGVKMGAWIAYHEEGVFPAKITTYAEGAQNGTYLEFNTRGHLTLRATYKNNKLDGPWAVYSFGRPEKEAHYKNGELDGVYLEYNRKTGNLQKEAHYKNGVQHGTYRFYSEEGEVMLEVEYVDGVKQEG